MNALINATEIKTMSSRDLLELINAARGEQGEAIIRLNKFNEKIVDELGDDDYTFSVVQNLNGTESTIYNLTPDQCTLIAMRESKSVRRVVLEKLKNPQPQISFAESLRLLADTVEAKERAEAQLAIAAPKVDYYDKIVVRENLLNASQVAQKLKMSAVKLNRLLEELDVYIGYSQAMFTLRGEAWVVETLVVEGLI